MSLVFPAQINPFELARNQALLHWQSRLGETLRMTQQADDGAAMWQRFAAVADPSACYESVHSFRASKMLSAILVYNT
ncbi:hypothetical protein B0D71_05810 [Pseudomonas laurylsulfativorans]|uniref:Uncharacterized protein n=1 Tax=Pseudomonas laurylsulfativorans TaxID=1943631 RepID=A0A2S3VXE6_9PSED|nr:hypothetical protein [Pseudomonas laurylsulfativorans]POF44299.1 hypothetical protein B0D71_05810 [Pseudomonas laurylsulfativorans]